MEKWSPIDLSQRIGGNIVNINGHEWWGYHGPQTLSLKIQPNFYSGLTTFGDTDVVQVKLLTNAFIKQGDVLTPLSDVIPKEFIYQDGIPLDQRVSIDLADAESLDPSNIINPLDYSGVLINA